MSPRASTKAPSKPKPKADVYVGLLLVSVAALVTGCIFLVLELNKYEWKLAP